MQLDAVQIATPTLQSNIIEISAGDLNTCLALQWMGARVTAAEPDANVIPAGALRRGGLLTICSYQQTWKPLAKAFETLLGFSAGASLGGTAERMRGTMKIFSASHKSVA